jgi:hypothetical protein
MFTRDDSLVAAISVIVLVIGAATGNAFVMFGLAAVALVLSALIYRWHRSGTVRSVVIIAFVASMVAGFVLSLG